jgi:hypothetical protein
MSPKKSKSRDYKAEYARRISRGIERGLSRSQAAGKAAKNELPASLQLTIPRNPEVFQAATVKYDEAGIGFNRGIFTLFQDANELANMTGNRDIIRLFKEAMEDQFRKPGPFDDFLDLRAKLLSQTSTEAGPGRGDTPRA